MQTPTLGWVFQVFQSEHQLFPAMYSQCVANPRWAEPYIIHILNPQPCGRLVSPDEKRQKKVFSPFLLLPPAGLNCLLTIKQGAKSYRCRDHFQRRGSRLQNKTTAVSVPSPCAQGVSRTSEKPSRKYRKRRFPRYRHRKHSPKQKTTCDINLRKGLRHHPVSQSTCRAGGEKM